VSAPADGRGDFDFLLGAWRVANRRSRRPLDPGEGTWEEFATDADVRPVLDGLGNTDTFRSPRGPDGLPFEGMTLRLFDPDDGLWRIWWASTRRPGHLDPPMTGSFTGAHGVFLGEDRVAGVPVRLRFDWHALDDGGARWEQSVSLDGGQSWRPNWVMSFARA
jgi:hypothetical protein